MNNIFSFSKKPIYLKSFIEWKHIYFLYFVLLLIVLNILGGGISFIIKESFNISHKMVSGNDVFRTIKMLLFAPVSEELIFRLILKENKKYFYVSGIMCIFLIIISIYTQYTAFLYSSSILIIIFLLYITQYKLKRNIYSIKNYKYLYWGSIIIFSLAHGVNYIFPNRLTILLTPLIVLPQFLGGIVLSYLRVKFGIKYSIIFHFFVNFL